MDGRCITVVNPLQAQAFQATLGPDSGEELSGSIAFSVCTFPPVTRSSLPSLSNHRFSITAFTLISSERVSTISTDRPHLQRSSHRIESSGLR